MSDRLRVLVFHHAVGFVHQSIPAAVEAILRLGEIRGIDVEATADPSRFDDDIRGYDAIVFVHTSGNVLPEPSQRRSLEEYIAGGGGFLGIHAASSMAPDVATDWPWFRDLVGASFKGHTVARIFTDEPVTERPGVIRGGPRAAVPPDAEWWGDSIGVTSWEAATIKVEDPDCPAIAGIRDGDVIVDEWYGFHDNPRPHVRVVATVDESTYEPYLGAMGDDHPIVWWREFGGGRSVYNAMGHSAGMWQDEQFLATIAGGIALASGRTDLRR